MPREIDVIQLWMSKFDKFASDCGKKILSSDDKADVINDILEILSDHMKDLDMNMDLMEKLNMFSKVQRLVSRAEKLVRNNESRKKDDTCWISDEVEKLSKIFDVSVTMKLDTPLSPKRKFSDDEFFPVSPFLLKHVLT